LIRNLVTHDSTEPGEQGCLTFKIYYGFSGRDKRLLSNILSNFPVSPCPVICVAIESIAISAAQFPPGICISTLQSSHQPMFSICSHEFAAVQKIPLINMSPSKEESFEIFDKN
jgi:hypothetical protein